MFKGMGIATTGAAIGLPVWEAVLGGRWRACGGCSDWICLSWGSGSSFRRGGRVAKLADPAGLRLQCYWLTSDVVVHPDGDANNAVLLK